MTKEEFLQQFVLTAIASGTGPWDALMVVGWGKRAWEAINDQD